MLVLTACEACEGGTAGEASASTGADDTSTGDASSGTESGAPTTGAVEDGSTGSSTTGASEDSGAVESSSSGTSGGEADDCRVGDLEVAPLPVAIDGAQAVAIDVLELSAELSFDVAAQTTSASAKLRFLVADAGRPIFDLRQSSISEVLLDGEAVDPTLVPERDLGGGPGTEMRVLGVELPACSEHTLELRYPLTTLVGFAAPAPDYDIDGVTWDFGFSDLAPRMFMEQWLPANLIHDRHPIVVTVQVLGAPEQPRLISNGEVSELGADHWQVEFPGYSTAQSPMLVLVPASRVESSSQMIMAEGSPAVAVELHRTVETPESSAQLHQLLADAFAGFSESSGEYAYTRFTAYVAINKGMEYDGGTTSTPFALPHELFHSWFGRGARPMHARDGWIDEAWDEYNTGNPKFPVTGLTMDDPLVRLYDPNPWGRTTPYASYDDGKLVFAAVAAAAGVPALRDSMRDFYEQHSLAQMTTQGLERHLTCSLRAPVVRSLFHRFVYGLEGAPEAMPDGYCR